MPAPLAPLVGFALGVLFAWAGGEEISRASGSLLGTKSLAIVVLFAFLVYGPFSGYFVTYATDWSFAYTVDGHRLPSALLLLLVLVNIAAVPIGFAIAGSRVRARRKIALLPMLTVPLALSAIFVAAFSRKLSLYGTYGQVARGFGVTPLAGSPVGYAILWFDACLLLAGAWTVRELRALTTKPRRA
jgi:hypothetical protein